MLRCTCLISIDTVFYGFYASTMLSWHDATRVSAVQWICQDGIHKGVVKYGVNTSIFLYDSSVHSPLPHHDMVNLVMSLHVHVLAGNNLTGIASQFATQII